MTAPRASLLTAALAILLAGVAAQEPAAAAQPAHFGRRPPAPRASCSCADPAPLPLANGSATVSAAASGTTPASWGRHRTPRACRAPRTAGAREFCGADIAVCADSLCCSQAGVCSADPDSCDGTCQCAWSGVGSACKGSYPFAKPRRLPTAPPGGVCGDYVAVCPDGQCCRHNWLITRRALAPDGFTRPVTVVNGAPFVTLAANVGDRIIITVLNGLTEPREALTIHWHGMLQLDTNIMDGVSTGTQRPVQPGETFTYNFIAYTAGTFWWHSHYSTQYVDGLWGALVILDPTRPQFEVDAVVTMNDWYHEPAAELTRYYLSPASGGNEPTPYTALLNGVGQGACEAGGATGCGYSYTRAIASSCASPKTRLRLVNAGSFAVFNVSIDAHRMLVIAEDGVEVDPVEVGSLQINNGQRYDVLPCQSAGAPLSMEPVWIRAVMLDRDFQSDSAWNQSLGVLYFTDTPPTTLPTTNATYLPPKLTPSAPPGPGVINPYSLRPLGNPTPPDATRRLEQVIDFYNEPRNATNATQYAHFNQIALSLKPEVPSLLERYSNNPLGIGPPSNPAVPPGGLGFHTVPVKRGEVIDIYIVNRDTGEHPLHLHGHWFTVMSFGAPDAGEAPSDIKLVPGIVRDTVTVARKSFIVLRYIANNPGMQIFHCHIDWHLAAGLGLIFEEGFPEETI
ncbi:fetC [Scenedesmus sp. PABB004]|nr:fetC [Scenedesmus sp. PABB004]